MAEKSKRAAEASGVRAIVWIAVSSTLLLTALLFRSAEAPRSPQDDSPQHDGLAKDSTPPSAAPAYSSPFTPALVAESRPQPPAATSSNAARATPTRESRRAATTPSHPPAPQSAAEVALVGPDPRAREPIPVLINELFSPDPEARLLAAMRLSRRSLYATEAVPVLKKLARDEPDPRVRKAMEEAILNIRGPIPAPFQFAIPRNKD